MPDNREPRTIAPRESAVFNNPPPGTGTWPPASVPAGPDAHGRVDVQQALNLFSGHSFRVSVKPDAATAGLAFEQVAHEVKALEALCASYVALGGPHGRRMARVRSALEDARLHAQEGAREVQEVPF